MNGDALARKRLKVCLLLQSTANRSRVTDWLSGDFDLVSMLPTESTTQIDLCMLDEESLKRNLSELIARKDAAEPAFLPYILLTEHEQKVRGENREIDELIDEVVSIPTRKSTFHATITDVLERRRQSMELSNQLEDRQQLFKTIFESSNDAILIIDPKLDTIRECNPRAVELFKYSREELLSRSPTDLVSEPIDEFRSVLDNVVDGENGRVLECECRTKHGREVTTEITASTVKTERSELVLINIRDVTRKRNRERILSNLHNVTAELMAATTETEIAEITTLAAQTVFNYEVAAVRLLDTDTRTLQLVAATDDTRRSLDEESPTYGVGEGEIDEIFRRQKPTIIEEIADEDAPIDRDPIRSAMCFPLGSHGVLIIGATEVSSFDEDDLEVTQTLANETKAALTRAERERTLKEQHEYLTELFENSTDSIVDAAFVDGKARIRDVNPEFERVFGYAADSIEGEYVRDLIVPADRMEKSKALFSRAISGERAEIESKRETVEGRRDFIVRVVPIEQDGDVIGGYIVYTDITEHKRQTQQLQVFNRVLRHNLRNKLNVIAGRVDQLAALSSGEESDTIRQRCLTAIDELLSFSETARQLTKHSEYETQPVPSLVSESVRKIAEDVSEEYERVEITAEISTRARVAGAIQLETCLRELCENAIEHHDKAHPSVTISATQGDEQSGWVEISVTDNGPGIPENEREVIQIGEETPLQHGSGLGLWMVNWIVQGAGGELSITDNEPRGAAVTFKLPTIDPENGSIGAPERMLNDD